MASTLGTNIDATLTPTTLDESPPKKPVAKGYTRILLEENEHIPPTGLFVAVDGKGYQLTTGVELDVPLSVAGVLTDAMMAFPQTDPSTQQVVGYRQRMRYPFRTIAA
jgi:hypothetical protein